LAVATPPAIARPQQAQRTPRAAGHPAQAQGRGGGQGLERLHPRRRGGKWILKKGDGYGLTGPDTTTKELQQRLQQLGFHNSEERKMGSPDGTVTTSPVRLEPTTPGSSGMNRRRVT
jgi:hypothetical protein